MTLKKSAIGRGKIWPGSSEYLVLVAGEHDRHEATAPAQVHVVSRLNLVEDCRQMRSGAGD
jgi:hypothetical protein